MGWHEEPPRSPKDDKSSGNEKDIWHRPRQQKNGPPDLDALLRQFKKKLTDAIAGQKNAGSSSPQPNGNANDPQKAQESDKKSEKNLGARVFFIVLALFIIWGVSGVFIVGPADQAVILQWGKYKETVGPGPHWIPSLMDQAIVKNVDKVSDYSYSAKMLTKDENIVSVSVAIQYRIRDLNDYLFNAADPQESLRQATASALRQVVGHSTLNEIIAEGREVWGDSVKTLLETILARYKVGIEIMSVSPQPARAPEEVQNAFDDAINAQEDEKRFKEQAYAYAARVIPIAEGQAKSIATAAAASERQSILNAQGQTAAFRSLLPEYQANPALMQERLYLDTMEKILSNTSKLLVDDSHSKNLLSLSLDALLQNLKKTPKNTSVDASESAMNNANSLGKASLASSPEDNGYGDRSDVRHVRGN